MDAVLFLKERKRMCEHFDRCSYGCPLNNVRGDEVCLEYMKDEPEKCVKIVETWSRENPVKTMMMDFFEKFPNAPKDAFGEPRGCPHECGYVKSSSCPDDENCFRCWSRPLEVTK